MMLPKRLVAACARMLGYDILPQWRLKDLPLARHLTRLFGLLGIDCVLDVGANTGQYTRFLREQVGYTGRIVAFEPLNANAALLKLAAAKDNRLHVRQCALGAVETELTINVMRDRAFSSFLSPLEAQPMEVRDMNIVDHDESVPIKRLDDLLPEIASLYGVQRFYLKMDTQGFDLQVVAGAEKVLPSIAALQSEMSVQPIYSGMPSFLKSLAVLRKKGFEVSGMYPVTRDRWLRLIEFDCVMVANRK